MLSNTALTLDKFLETRHFDFQEIEDQIRKYWKEHQIYKYDFDDNQDNSYLIDTPPPYANGALHHGHAMSYTQLDIIARYNRMRRPTLLPLAFDDNGLPTERYTEKKYNIQPGEHPDNFFELCKIEAMKGIEAQKDQFDRFGFSYHPDIAYRTIDDRSIRITQQDFLELYHKGLIIHTKEPQLYCTHCQTALAQADLQTKESKTEMHDIEFPNKIEDEEGIIISTTRPELIPAVEAIFYHPDDDRRNYQDLIILNPITKQEIPIISDELVDRDTGTGIMMCATFGDQLDIELYRKHNLSNSTIIDHKGLIQYSGYEGLKPEEARLKIIEKLKTSNHWIGSKEINHQIPCCERCDTPMEIIESYQWSLDILTAKDGLLEFIDDLEIYPNYMKKRLVNWIKGLKWNWILSRQRYYGIPIPIWHCQSCNGKISPDLSELPILPGSQKDKTCQSCGGIAIADSDVFDTWMASSLTPRILMDRFFEDDLKKPLQIRSQAHEIIRTWAFYSLIKQYLSGNKILPWQNLLICGWGLGFKNKGKRGTKASKSSGSGFNPNDLIKEYSADALRYWAANAKLGKDQYLMQAVLNRGKKIQTKLFNAAKITFILINQTESKLDDEIDLITDLDRSIQSLQKEYESLMSRYDYNDALNKLEFQFWDGYCSTQIEDFKNLGYSNGLSIKERNAILKAWKSYLFMFAPFLPFITEYLSLLTHSIIDRNGEKLEFIKSTYKSIHLQN